MTALREALTTDTSESDAQTLGQVSDELFAVVSLLSSNGALRRALTDPAMDSDLKQRLVDNLLNLARIEAGVVAVNKTALSLNELLAEALGVMQPAAQDKQIALGSEISPLYLGVLADRDMLLQAAINLLRYDSHKLVTRERNLCEFFNNFIRNQRQIDREDLRPRPCAHFARYRPENRRS